MMEEDGSTFAAPLGVAVIDKNPLVRRGLGQMLHEDGRFRMVMEASDGADFVRQFETVENPGAVDIVVAGWVMPNMDGRGLLQRLAGMAATPKVVIYTGEFNDPAARAAAREGARAFCSKSEPPEALLEVIVAVSEGDRVFPLSAGADSPLDTLTRRERELLASLANGSTNAQLAEELGVSVNTIKFHLRNLYEKLDVRNRAQAVALFLNEGHGD